jgi:hypothetical protein
MYKVFFTFFLFSIMVIKSFGQTNNDKDSLSTDSLTKNSKIEASIDSLLSNRSSSYLQVGFGIGNELYSIHNQVLNAKQVTPPIVLTPTIAYFNKSGISISANDYLLNENHSFGANQYSVTPSYETLPGSTLDFLFSYTHYFINNEYSSYSSPIQNDFYSSLVYKKTWLQPGFALGYSAGYSKEAIKLDTTINGVKKHLYDSLTNNLKLFTTILSVQHNFGWNTVFTHDDSISFVPIFMLNLGSSGGNVINDDNLTAELGTTFTKAQISALRTKLQQKIKKQNKLQTLSFRAESLGMDLQASYTVGNFAIEPDIYFDYYLPQTTINRFTQVFVVNFNYAF